MIKLHTLATATLASALLTGAALATAPAPAARLTMAQARVIAMKVARGQVTKQDYEKEKGAWRYSFDVREGKRIHEIGVDANTGRIVENVFEKPGAAD